MNRLAEAEPLSRRHLQIFAEFGHCTGYEHPHFRAAIEHYTALLKAMGMSEDEIKLGPEYARQNNLGLDGEKVFSP